MADGDGDGLTIGEIAREAGVSASAIRYYEKAGLLSDPPRSAGRRTYPRDALTSLAVIKLAKEAGFTIAEIRTLMTGFDPDVAASERWRTMAERKLPEIQERIDRARAVKALLEESLRCGCLRIEDCRPLERFR